jgi:hypothetical protein
MNRRLQLPQLLIAALCAVSLAASTVARAQGPGVHTMPKAPQKDDVLEVEEVDGGTGFDAAKTGRSELDAAGAAEDPAFRDEVEREALALSQAEMRARFRYLVALSVGNARAWETYALAGGAPVSQEAVVTLFAGTGRLSSSGLEDDAAYDLTVEARSTGVEYRWFVPRLDGLSLSASTGYVAWSGKVDPQGAEGDDLLGGEDPDAAVDSADPRLTSGFEATGLFVGLGAAVSWLWENGVYLEWTLVGLRKTKVLESTFDRDSDLAEKVAVRDLERVAFYGLANLKVGYFF